MQKLLFITIIISVSCSCPEQNLQKKQSVFLQNNFSDSVFCALYDVADLKNYSDNRKYIARLTYNIPFGNNTVIEMDEIANGINLCVKQPVVTLTNAEYFSTQRSLPFNQLCYFYVDSPAKNIKALFQPYNTGTETFSFKCKGCFDPVSWKLEVYDHGLYSVVQKDDLLALDSVVTEQLLRLVQLNKENGYRINVPKPYILKQ